MGRATESEKTRAKRGCSWRGRVGRERGQVLQFSSIQVFMYSGIPVFQYPSIVT